MIEQVNGSDYVILCNRLIDGKIDEEKEDYLREACNLINCKYYPNEIMDMVNENKIPDLNEIVREFLGI